MEKCITRDYYSVFHLLWSWHEICTCKLFLEWIESSVFWEGGTISKLTVKQDLQNNFWKNKQEKGVNTSNDLDVLLNSPSTRSNYLFSFSQVITDNWMQAWGRVSQKKQGVVFQGVCFFFFPCLYVLVYKFFVILSI